MIGASLLESTCPSAMQLDAATVLAYGYPISPNTQALAALWHSRSGMAAQRTASGQNGPVRSAPLALGHAVHNLGATMPYLLPP